MPGTTSIIINDGIDKGVQFPEWFLIAQIILYILALGILAWKITEHIARAIGEDDKD
jgi:uncharacterized membrane protein YhdT